MKQLASVAPMVLMMFLSSLKSAPQENSYPFTIQKSGQGKQSIIFIPGFASSGEVWNDAKAGLEKNFTCYTLTMAGFAGVPPQPNATFKSWETSIAKYIKNNKIEKPVLVGHSMGGGLALAIASDYPELIKKIVIVDALPCLNAFTNPAFTSKQFNDCSEIVNKMDGMTNEQFYQMQKVSIARLVADTSKQAMIVGWSMNSDRKTFAAMYCDFLNTDLRENIKNITCPSLILLEQYFTNFKPAVAQQYKNLENANIQYASKGLHFIMYDDKDWYLSKLNDFITSK